MAFVVTRPCRIGDGIREPGYVLTSEDMRGRNLRHMEDVDRCIRFDPSVPEPVVVEAEDGDEELDSLSRADLNARAEAAGVEDAEKLPNKAAVIEAIQNAEAEDGDEKLDEG